MKKTVIAAIAGALALSMLSPAGAQGSKQQKVEGSIALPAFFYGEAQGTAGCWGGGHRRLNTAGQGMAPNGVVGYEFDVDKITWNKNFVLEVTGGEGTVDLDIYLYGHYPTLDEWQNDPVNGGAPVSVEFTTRAEGGESGKVPANTVKAIVCMYAGTAGYGGANASFTVTAGKGVKLPKA